MTEFNHFTLESHSFNVGVAKATSIDAAVIFNHIFFWIKINKQNGKNKIEGRTWMYQSISEMMYHFPYLTEKQIRVGLNQLEEAGFLIKGNHSENKFNRTSWYALANEEMLDIQKMFTKRPIGQIDLPVRSPYMANGDATGGECPPYIDKDNKEDNKNIAQTSGKPASEQKISFSFEEAKFLGITDKDISAWEAAFPDLNISQQIALAAVWMQANPRKAKTQWRKFLSGWFARSQDKSENRKAYSSIGNSPKILEFQEKKPLSEEAKRNKDKIKKFIETIEFPDYQYRMEAGEDFVFVACGSGSYPIDYNDKNFEGLIDRAYNKLKSLDKLVLRRQGSNN